MSARGWSWSLSARGHQSMLLTVVSTEQLCFLQAGHVTILHSGSLILKVEQKETEDRRGVAG